jgi:Uma2 family endonuclease
MPKTQTPAQEHQEQWQDITSDSLLSELPYKVETNSRGQIVLSPQTNRHSRQQRRIVKQFKSLLHSGEAFQEWAIATSGGTKQADVIWTSDDRLREMEQTGDPTTLAPEICVEVMSDSNDWDEMHEKRALYLEAGAEEVWVVDQKGRIQFFGEEELETSDIVPEFPKRL